MADEEEGHYGVLGIQRSASQEDIRKAYRECSLKYHPDKNINDPDAKLKFQRVSEAFAVLSDVSKRMEYNNSKGFNLQGTAAGRSRSRSAKGRAVRKNAKEVRMLRVGDSVQLEGLHAMPELNGICGAIAHYDIPACRWHVELPSGEVKALRRENLVLMPMRRQQASQKPGTEEDGNEQNKANGAAEVDPSTKKPRGIKFVMAEEKETSTGRVEIIDPKGKPMADLSSDEETANAKPTGIQPPVRKAVESGPPVLVPVKPPAPAPDAQGNFTLNLAGVRTGRKEAKMKVEEESKRILANMTEQVKKCLERMQDPTLDSSSREKYQKLVNTLQAKMVKVKKV